MKAKSNIPKVAFDLFALQLAWSFWFMVFVLLAYLVMLAIGSAHSDFLNFAYRPAKGYMLVIGISSASSFLTFYVKHGVTRRDCFAGSAIASVLHAATLAAILGIGTGLQYLLFQPPSQASALLDVRESWLSALLIFGINILTYYVAGWLISVGFYRNGWPLGIGFIALALLIVAAANIFWESDLQGRLSRLLPLDPSGIPPHISYLGTIVMLGLALAIIRLCTRRIVIRMK